MKTTTKLLLSALFLLPILAGCGDGDQSTPTGSSVGGGKVDPTKVPAADQKMIEDSNAQIDAQAKANADREKKMQGGG
jgi:PBP1b-binding outer membrane lipoprotein LpoB